jgi:membrane fusion protein (multidrug efflux system)
MGKGWMVSGLAATLAGAGLFLGCRHAAPPPMIPEVAFQVVQAQRVTLTTELPGRTTPFLVAEIRPQVNGIVQKKLFQEGSDVKAGSTLYQLDPTPYRAALEQARAALSSAQANLPAAKSRAERTRGLAEIHAVGQQDADDAESAYQQAMAAVASAQATVQSAEFNLANTPITAPISGRTGLSSVTVGALVTAYQPTTLVTVQQLDPIYVDVTQSSADLLRLRRRLESGRLHSGADSAKVKLILEDGSAYPLPGHLQFRDATVEPSTGAVTLRMVFPNPRHELLPGMFVRAVVEEGIDDRAILALQQGVTRDPRGNALALVVGAGDQVEQRQLTLDRAIGDQWVVSSGLAPGDRLIVEGLQKVRPGAAVRAVPFVAPPPAPAGQPAPAAAARP